MDMSAATQGIESQNDCQYNLTPAYSAHPGEILKDEIEYRGISQLCTKRRHLERNAVYLLEKRQ